jgi:hypothetical protein
VVLIFLNEATPESYPVELHQIASIFIGLLPPNRVLPPPIILPLFSVYLQLAGFAENPLELVAPESEYQLNASVWELAVSFILPPATIPSPKQVVKVLHSISEGI